MNFITSRGEAENNQDEYIQKENEMLSFSNSCVPQDNSFHMAEVLHQRLDSLNELVRRRSSIRIHDASKPEKDTNEIILGGSVCGEVGAKVDNKFVTFDASEKPRVPQTDAGRRLEILFDRYKAENDGDEKASSNTCTKRKHSKALNRSQIKRGERRKASIKALQRQLKTISSRHFSRSANSLRFKVNRDPSSHGESNMTTERQFPIPVGDCEMCPNLLLTLSCEKLAVDRGTRLLKAIVLHQISIDLFVLMYWFIHCRFFQVSPRS